MLNQKYHPGRGQNPYQCETRRQHFNHLRNSSSSMRNCLSWGVDADICDHHIHDRETQLPQRNFQKLQQDQLNKQKRNVVFDIKQNTINQGNQSKLNNTTITNKKTQISQNNSFDARQRSKSAKKPNKKGKQEDADVEIRNKIRQRQLEIEAGNKQQRRQKVEQYLQNLKPYTRSLTNTKYQDYFNKAAFESYGRENTKNAIGGIIYGNHQKTFNLNPHIRGNEPKCYQTHTTTINYGKRTKLNEQDKWVRLQKQLTKKLGLKDKNETLKEGKEVVYVDVDDSNMHSVMKENLKFKKQHDEEIRNLQKDYKKQIENQKKATIEEFYAQKKERIMSNNTIDSQNSTYVCDRDQRGRLQEQVIYRHTDKDGNVRIGADRHALTCFVDMNFPQNDAAYTKELVDRMQIFPIEVEEKDKRIDDRRRANYEKSLQNIYPSHYLLPNCDQPEIIKMINNKYGQIQNEKILTNKGTKQMASTFGTTIGNNSSFSPVQH